MDDGLKGDIHFDQLSNDPTDWLRWLRSGMLPESDTLRALAHISACKNCRRMYEEAQPFAPGEFEARVRPRLTNTGLN